MKIKQKDLAIIAGCGNMGASIAFMLSEQGKDVKIIDMDRDSFQNLGNHLEIEKLEADAADIDILKQCGIERAAIFLAATGSDRTNIMIAEIVKQVFKVQKVVARIYDYKANEQFVDGSEIIPIYPYLLTVQELERCFNE
ncbi:NAD-binding protein [Sinanaerobacter chloroacetimidivorans]|jgi:trk system potassium uptake protein TrkA|uniref:NAD-binding protein n=1 Tax=Sinanaerobacter chloroacetimidivorans TaxID=2818044 RepID=A0A8J7W0K3_9FIRM|nr:NAD-binding protein [Sinanaerobacter chloroacetimidivorans]MBR0597018.1 NAD-binding protein [Sinanaerobacter chloroacetimidivorans]